MIPRLPGWSWQARPDSILLAAPQGPQAGAIRYIEKLRPVERLGDLVARHTPAALADARLSSSERLVTREGEYAALAIQAATLPDGNDVRRALGFVFVGDYYAYVGGMAPAAASDALIEAVRALTVDDKHQRLPRRRGFLFRAPDGDDGAWAALALVGGAARYFAPGFPRVAATITVHPAVPFAADVTPTIDLQRLDGEDLVAGEAGPPSGFAVAHRGPSQLVEAASGLRGTRWSIRGRWEGQPPIARDIVILRDHRYAYTAELRSTGEHPPAARAAFDASVQSIEPLPGPGVQHERAGEQFSYLFD